MRAMTVRQPYAWAIVYLDKRVENRGRRNPWLSAVGERIAIHAAAQPVDDYDDALHEETFLTTPIPFTWEEREYLDVRGALLGSAEVTGVHHADYCKVRCSDWAQPDQWHIELTDVRHLVVPLPARGALGLWKLTPGQQQTMERAGVA